MKQILMGFLSAFSPLILMCQSLHDVEYSWVKADSGIIDIERSIVRWPNGALRTESWYYRIESHPNIYVPVFYHYEYRITGELARVAYFPYKNEEKHYQRAFFRNGKVEFHYEMDADEYQEKKDDVELVDRKGNNFTFDKLDGWYAIHYRPNGNKYSEGFYRDGKCVGTWKLYDKEGNVRKIKEYKQKR